MGEVRVIKFTCDLKPERLINVTNKMNKAAHDSDGLKPTWQMLTGVNINYEILFKIYKKEAV